MERELDCAIDDGVNVIIALGNEVKSQVDKWRMKGKDKNREMPKIVNLPHPSGQNNSIWYRSRKTQKKVEKTEECIGKLLAHLP